MELSMTTETNIVNMPKKRPRKLSNADSLLKAKRLTDGMLPFLSGFQGLESKAKELREAILEELINQERKLGI